MVLDVLIPAPGQAQLVLVLDLVNRMQVDERKKNTNKKNQIP